MADVTPRAICDMLSQILHLIPEEAQETFKLSKPEFMYIPASYDIKKSIQRIKEFKKSIPRQAPNLSASSFLFWLSKMNLSTEVEKNISKALKLINSQICEHHKRLSRDDLLYLVRIWGFFSEKSNGVDEFYRYYSKELENILMTNPLKKMNTYQGILFNFRADNDRFYIKRGLCIRRLYPWEYSELIVEMLKMRDWFKLPALETLAEANFILEVDSNILKGKDDWARLHDLRKIVDIISVASKGHVWAPLFMFRRKDLIQWHEGVRGKDFSGMVGIIPAEQTPIFMNRVRRGLKIRDNIVFRTVCRSLRQEEEDYGFEFRLVRLFSSLEMLLGSPGVGCGMKLAWLLGKEPRQRKNIFEEFKKIKGLRDKIIHEVLLYDLMTSREQSETLSSIYKLHNWLFNVLANFLDCNLPLKDWQNNLNLKLFGK